MPNLHLLDLGFRRKMQLDETAVEQKAGEHSNGDRIMGRARRQAIESYKHPESTLIIGRYIRWQ